MRSFTNDMRLVRVRQSHTQTCRHSPKLTCPSSKRCRRTSAKYWRPNTPAFCASPYTPEPLAEPPPPNCFCGNNTVPWERQAPRYFLRTLSAGSVLELNNMFYYSSWHLGSHEKILQIRHKFIQHWHWLHCCWRNADRVKDITPTTQPTSPVVP
jgi:hypothetical protein